MASEGRAGSSPHEIVARQDQICIKCRGKCFRGGRIWWDPRTSQVWHVVCPPVVQIAASVYESPPVGPDLWKRYCKEIADMVAGKNTERKVTAEDRKAYEASGFPGMLHSVVSRTRCTGQEAVEIVRSWIDSLKAPVDEEKFRKVNEKLKAVVHA